jgi:hypothetical protein
MIKKLEERVRSLEGEVGFLRKENKDQQEKIVMV